jgi:hypothetical protein
MGLLVLIINKNASLYLTIFYFSYVQLIKRALEVPDVLW